MCIIQAQIFLFCAEVFCGFMFPKSSNTRNSVSGFISKEEIYLKSFTKKIEKKKMENEFISDPNLIP